MLEVVSTAKVKLYIRPVVIGSRFTGKYQAYLNKATGDYSECLPDVAVRLQRALLCDKKAPWYSIFQ